MDASNRVGCLTGTRGDIIEYIDNWVLNMESEHRVLWLHGVAGCGKSALQTTIYNRFSTAGRLGAFLSTGMSLNGETQPS
jgi:hypothetical protein